jgi:non-ribosomal peptide synthetase component F/thioesterase domain-containing protein
VTSSEPTNPLSSERAAGSAEPEELFVLPTSLGQERFWGLDRQNPGNPTWNVPVRFRLQGSLNVELLERAFNEIVRRHETLRTIFAVVDGQPAQVVKPSLQIKVPVTDLRHLPQSERDAEADRLSFQEARWRFNLAKGPLFRVSLLRVADNEYVMLVTPHHTVTDYWSVGLVSNELGALYDAYSRGLEPLLPELPIQYADYAIWQREQAQGAIVQKELEYWKTQLEDLPLAEFPTDHLRGPFPTYEATITSVLLNVKLTDAIREIGNLEGATFFNTMLAALSVVLQQYSGQTDFGVATQVAGRTNLETERLIGMFINSVVLRMDLSGDPTFTRLVSRVQEVGLQSIAHQNLRFEQLLKELRPNDYPSHHTLFRLNFICQRDPVKPLEFSGIKLTVIPSKCQGALYDLNVFLVLRNEGWRLACEYNTDLYEAGTITRLLGDYKSLLELVAENPKRHLSEFPMSEGARLVKERKRGSGTPSNPAGGGDALGGASDKIHGMGASSPSPSPTKGAASIVATLPEQACEESVALPASEAQRRFWFLEEIAPGNPALHMRACVRLTGALDVPRLEESLQALVRRHEILRTTFSSRDGELLQIIAPSRKLSLRVTSLEQAVNGSLDTKLHDAIRTEVSAPLDLADGPLMRARLIRLASREHVLVLTTHHILVDGWSQNVIQRDLWTIYEALAEGREPSLPILTIQYGDFAHWQREWLDSDQARIELGYWKKQLAPPVAVLNIPTDRPPRNRPAHEGAMETLLLPKDLIRSLKNLSQSEHVTMFMTMLAGYSALLHGLTGQDNFVIGSPVANRNGETEPLIGPFAGPVALRLNLTGNPTLRALLERIREITLEALSHTDLPFEVLLEKLQVRAVQGRNPLSQCYFFYQTAFLQPRELGELTVTPLPDFALGTHYELQMGLLERREGVRAQLEYNPDLYDGATIQSILGDYCRILEAIVQDPEARIDQLCGFVQQKPAVAAELSSRDFVVPRDEIEKQLAEIWEKVLGVRPIGLHENYFELGGTSLLAVRLFAEIDKAFHTKLPLSSLFEAQTIQELAETLRHADGAPTWSPLVAIQREGSRPPLFCIHGAGGNILIYRELALRLGADQPVYGLQAQGLDGELPALGTIEEMAALYVEEIRRIQLHGPYYLGGYCMGGTIALEMAQQLNGMGEETALLALFDTMNWSKVSTARIWQKPYHIAQRVGFHGMNFFLLDFQDKIKFFKGKFKALRSRSYVWRGMLLGKLGQKRSESSNKSVLLARIWEANDRAILTYIPRAYAGKIADFRPMVQYARYSSPELKWGQLARGGQEIITLPVYPAGMLLEPFVQHLANALTAAIDKAIQATSLAS